MLVSEKKAQRKRCYNITFGFYAIMGGLAVDISDIHDTASRATLTPSSLLCLADDGNFIELSDEEIRDKSKADFVAKALVMLQVTWLFLQCISRKASGLPLAPLEVHTLVHAGCATIIYCAWFHKPLDVRAPTLVPMSGKEDIVALMTVQSKAFHSSRWNRPRRHHVISQSIEMNSLVDVKLPTEADYMIMENTGSAPNEKKTYNEQGVSAAESLERSKTPDNGVHKVQGRHVNCYASPIFHVVPAVEVKTVCTFLSGEHVKSGVGPMVMRAAWYTPEELQNKKDTAFAETILPKEEGLDHVYVPDAGHQPDRPPKYYRYRMALSLSAKGVRRWERAGAAFAKGTKYRRTLEPAEEYEEHAVYRKLIDRLPDLPTARELLVRRSSNLGTHDLWVFRGLTFSEIASISLCVLTSSLYGGVHLALWFHPFPTQAEVLLWRKSAVALTTVPAAYLCLAIPTPLLARYYSVTAPRAITAVVRPVEEAMIAVFTAPRSSPLAWLGSALLIIGLFITAGATLLCLFARVFLVIESFISLRHVPLGVYAGVGWSGYIPHG